MSPSLASERAVWPLVDAPQLAARQADPLDREVGAPGRRAQAREVLGGRRHAPLLHRGGKRNRGPDHAARPAPEAPVLRADRAAGPTDVEHRRQVDVDSDALQVARRAGALAAAVVGASAAHLLCRGVRGSRKSLHEPALLVDHHQHGIPQALGPVDRLQTPDQPAGMVAASEVVGGQDHAGQPPVADHPLERLRRPPAAIEAGDQPLAGQPPRGQVAWHRLPSGWSRRRGPPSRATPTATTVSPATARRLQKVSCPGRARIL